MILLESSLCIYDNRYVNELLESAYFLPFSKLASKFFEILNFYCRVVTSHAWVLSTIKSQDDCGPRTS